MACRLQIRPHRYRLGDKSGGHCPLSVSRELFFPTNQMRSRSGDQKSRASSRAKNFSFSNMLPRTRFQQCFAKTTCRSLLVQKLRRLTFRLGTPAPDEKLGPHSGSRVSTVILYETHRAL